MYMRRIFPASVAIATIALVFTLAGCDSASEEQGDVFYVPFEKQVLINERPGGCGSSPEYSVGHPEYTATFEAVDGATSYTGRVKVSDGQFAASFPLANVAEVGDKLRYTLGVGPIRLYLTCNLGDAESERADRLDYLESVNHQGIEITAVF